MFPVQSEKWILFIKKIPENDQKTQIAVAIIAAGYSGHWTAGQSYQPYEIFPPSFNLLDNTTLMEIVECGAHR
jgi:hypothetical protein